MQMGDYGDQSRLRMTEWTHIHPSTSGQIPSSLLPCVSVILSVSAMLKNSHQMHDHNYFRNFLCVCFFLNPSNTEKCKTMYKQYEGKVLKC